MVTQDSLADGDGPVLRRELALRILLQNLLLVLSLALFTAFAILSLARPEVAWGAAAAQGAAGLGAALQWCHHGIRTKQIKKFLLTLDGGHAEGWERWLPANRPGTLLGSRWLISTKGVFLGLQLAMIGLSWRMGPVLDGFFASVAAILLLASAGFLLTNPKEQGLS
jgi:multisubunit Na+/H+ antiporter MnhG subunit